MPTQADMKLRIAQELRRDDLTTEIANAISTAIAFFQFERFTTFNTSSVQAPPATDGEAGNPWMNVAEPLIRNRAKAELYAGVMKEPQNAKLYLDLSEQWRGQLKLSQYFQTYNNATAGTLGYLKAKIANEIERGDLTNEIAAAVATAIGYYQSERFYFNETRDILFNTVGQQYQYTSSDAPDLGNLIKIDYAFAYIGGQPYRIFPIMPEIMEWSHLATNDPVGQPFRFNYYGSKFNLYPTPDQPYPIRVGGHKIVAAPAADGTVGNIWMTDGENMVRARAKFELYAHVPIIKDPQKASDMRALADEAYKQLKDRTADLEKVGDFEIEPWGY